MRRVAEIYIAAACAAGVVFVSFTLANSTPPHWVLDIALVAVLITLVAILSLNRLERGSWIG